jgi:hypothetical protein
VKDDVDHVGEVWQVDVMPHALRIHYVLCRSSERSDRWETLIMYDYPHGEEGITEFLTSWELSGELFYWSRLL